VLIFTSTRRIRADFVARDTQGNIHVFEAKYAIGGLTPNQTALGVFDISRPSNVNAALGGGVIRPLQGTQGTYTVAIGSNRGIPLGGRGATGDATFHVIKYGQ
jgi:hypothetical protein